MAKREGDDRALGEHGERDENVGPEHVDAAALANGLPPKTPGGEAGEAGEKTAGEKDSRRREDDAAGELGAGAEVEEIGRELRGDCGPKNRPEEVVRGGAPDDGTEFVAPGVFGDRETGEGGHQAGDHRHVGDRLAGHEGKEGGAEEDGDAQPGDSARHELGEHPPEEGEPENRGENKGKADREDRQRGACELARVATAARDPKELHARGDKPKGENRLGAEGLILPLEVDKVVVFEHAARHFAVVGLPGIDEREAPEARYEKGEGGGDD